MNSTRKLRTPVTTKTRSTYEVSVVMPCLNEAETVGQCVLEAKKWIGKKKGEVIVVDNGSTDSSAKIARLAGARVVTQKTRGYGAAIYKGLQAARGTYIFIADADMSYDLRHLTPFLQKLKAGSDVVIGNRFAGRIHDQAMPWLHRYIGNPVLTWIANLFFGTHLGDYHSGVRAMKKTVVNQLQLQCVGMEFASEMIVRAALLDFKIDQVAVQYRPDGRSRKSHLRTFRDGWRHLRFLMLFAPNWIFFFPAVIILLSSLSLLIWMILESLTLGQVSLGVHTMLVLGGLLIIGYQLFHWSLCGNVFAKRIQLPVRSLKVIEKFSKANFDLMMIIGGVVFLVGMSFCLWTFSLWIREDLGDLHPEQTMRIFIPGVVFVILGVQIFFSTLFLGLLNFEQIQQDQS